MIDGDDGEGGCVAVLETRPTPGKLHQRHAVRAAGHGKHSGGERLKAGKRRQKRSVANDA
jgi:hypothetical protein